jgi:hypothetical protein
MAADDCAGHTRAVASEHANAHAGRRSAHLGHRHGLAGEGRAVDKHFGALHEARVGADAVALGDDDHVAGHQHLRLDLCLHAVAHHARSRRQPANASA